MACSGGCDSSALAIALAGSGARMVVGHVLHDLRPGPDPEADRDAVRELSGRLSVPFLEARVAVSALRGNPEGLARAARYRALAGMARASGCRYVASAHHGDDLIETMLMRLLRGAGPGGLGGLHPKRVLGGGVTLVRPMLGVSRGDAREVCRAAGWEWREDASNADATRLRAAIRSRVVPILKELGPTLVLRAGITRELLADAAGLIGDRAEELGQRARASPRCVEWTRSDLAAERAVVVGEVLRRAIASVCEGRGADRVSARSLFQVASVIRGDVHNRKTFRLAGAEIMITGRGVQVRASDSPQAV
ncbi:MAG: tRNA lysidine(34) synthetase TilS [Phycisphaerales bacterium]|nr:tRNA lysidine(34) synthetase TilS [Phycisphaerales bacterium]